MPDRRKLRPRKEPSQERSRQTVEAILQATAYILVAGGYPALTTNRVAERAGVNIATLYQYFPSKDAIFAELLRRHVTETRAAALAVLVSKRGRGLEATARAMVEAGIAAHRITPALHRIFTEEAPRLGLGPVDAPTDGELEREAQAWLDTGAGPLPDPDLTLWIARSAVHAVIHLTIAQRPADLERPQLADELTRLVTGYLHR